MLDVRGAPGLLGHFGTGLTPRIRIRPGAFPPVVSLSPFGHGIHGRDWWVGEGAGVRTVRDTGVLRGREGWCGGHKTGGRSVSGHGGCRAGVGRVGSRVHEGQAAGLPFPTRQRDRSRRSTAGGAGRIERDVPTSRHIFRQSPPTKKRRTHQPINALPLRGRAFKRTDPTQRETKQGKTPVKKCRLRDHPLCAKNRWTTASPGCWGERQPPAPRRDAEQRVPRGVAWRPP